MMAAAKARIAIVVSRFNRSVTDNLLEGARDAVREHNLACDDDDVFAVPGAFELPLVARVAASRDRYAAVVCLGAVIRGETPHFEYVAGEATRGLGEIALRHGLPVGFGLLTVDTMQQAADRAGGSAGNKGHEAAAAAIGAADVIAQLRTHHAAG